MNIITSQCGLRSIKNNDKNKRLRMINRIRINCLNWNN